MDEIECLNCGETLEPCDYFGKTIGWDRLHNEPIFKEQNPIYFCQKCQKYFYSIEGNIFAGYPL
jgi:hypothetical protein